MYESLYDLPIRKKNYMKLKKIWFFLI